MTSKTSSKPAARPLDPGAAVTAAWLIELSALALVAVPSAVLLALAYARVGLVPAVLLALPMWEAAHFAFALLVALVLRRLPRLEPGRTVRLEEHPWSLCHMAIMSSLRMRAAARRFLTSPGPQACVYRAMGMRLGRNVIIHDSVTITEPHLVSIGDGSVLGFEASLFPHIIPQRSLYCQAPITIGRNVLIGARSTIWPGVKIGDGAVILTNSVVNPETEIGPGETWGGVPARRIRPANEAGSESSTASPEPKTG